MSKRRWHTIGLIAEGIALAFPVLLGVGLTIAIFTRTAETDSHGYVILFGAPALAIMAFLVGAGIVGTVEWMRSGTTALVVVVDLILLAAGVFALQRYIDTGGSPAAITIAAAFNLALVIALVCIWRSKSGDSLPRDAAKAS